MRSILQRLFSKKPITTYLAQPTTTRRNTDVWQRLWPILKYFNNAPSPLLRRQRMDIRKDQFAVEAVRLLQDIADSHFISFDFEFSGIAERDRNRATKQTVQERYEETRISVQEYQPLQIGLTIVKYDDKKSKLYQLHSLWVKFCTNILEFSRYRLSADFIQNVTYLSHTI